MLPKGSGTRFPLRMDELSFVIMNRKQHLK